MKIEDKIKLRKPELKDYIANYETQQDPDTAKNFMSYPHNLEEAKKEIEDSIKQNKAGTAHNYVIEVDGEFAGRISLHHIKNGKAIITYNIGKKFRGKGITSKATKEMIEKGFNNYKLNKIEGHVREFNIPSIKILEKTGFKLVKRIKNAVERDGKKYDDLVYVLEK